MEGRRSSWGVALIILGGLLLVFTTGVLPWGAWTYLADWWPILLVAAGVQLIWRRRLDPAALVAVGCAIVVAGGFLVAAGVLPAEPGAGTHVLNQPLAEGVSEAEVRLDFGAGRLNVTAGPENELAEGHLKYFRHPPKVDCRQEGGRARLVVSMERESWAAWPFRRGGIEWQLALTPRIPLDVKMFGGACRADLDLAALKIRELDLRVGAGEVELTLGAQGMPGRISIEAGASKITLRAPAEVGLRASIDGAAASQNFAEAGLIRRDGYWETAGYLEANTKFDINIEAGASQVRIERPIGPSGMWSGDRLANGC